MKFEKGNERLGLSEKYKLALATNGIERIQRNRLSDFMPYTYKTYMWQYRNGYLQRFSYGYGKGWSKFIWIQQ